MPTSPCMLFALTHWCPIPCTEPTQAETLRHRYGGSVGLAQLLHVDPSRGLVADDATGIEARREWFGANRVPVPKQRPLWLLMWDALHDVTLIVLMIAGVVSLIAGVGFEEDKEVCGAFALFSFSPFACRHLLSLAVVRVDSGADQVGGCVPQSTPD